MTKRLGPLALLLFVALGPSARADTLLYDGTLNTTPDAQGWFYLADPFTGALATRGAGGGVTTLSTSALSAIQAGYFSRNPFTDQSMPGMPTLDRATGYTVVVDARIDQESHQKESRAGFSLIALGNDGKGIELGFWTNEIWAQSDNPAFIRAESAVFDTTQTMVSYKLVVLGDSYSLFAGDTLLLQGALRDYSSSGLPYTLEDFLFLGDDTTSASATVRLSRVAVLSFPVPEPSTLLLASLGGPLALASTRLARRARATRS